ncbi:hypothetical protein SKAU_G00380530 [Synaphobranchus kaupii]|uniref:Uncharacterized protein n=1 Tax=Synaphobranchus kaupii TaxID=118154 RepID=A0A9Q1EDJ8_SYNKA|nr:hypothetical protein SKAU_G00380530 [Synaphobranchus kaupii]
MGCNPERRSRRGGMSGEIQRGIAANPVRGTASSRFLHGSVPTAPPQPRPERARNVHGFTQVRNSAFFRAHLRLALRAVRFTQNSQCRCLTAYTPHCT